MLSLWQETAQAVDHYMTQLERELGVALGPNDWIIRSSRGVIYGVRHTFSADFRDVRQAVFPGDARQLLDIRRSAATEAHEGGATKDEIGEIMANTLAKDAKLQATYVLTTSKKIVAAREVGRSKLADKFRNSPR